MKLSILLYLDPGTGSYIIQAIIAGVIGIAFFFKNLRIKILSFFGMLKYDDDKEKNDQSKTENKL